MKLAYWPGCVSRGFTPELHGSVAKVAPLLDLELVELDRANCCGAGVIAEHNQELADTLNARTFAMAQQVEGAAGMMNICSTCQGAQSECQERLDASSNYRAEVNTHLDAEGLSYQAGGDWWNKNFLWILAEEIGFDAVRERVQRPLAGLRIAPFYGCYIVRPSKRLGFDEHPGRDSYLGELIEALGGEAVEYAGARKCCGFPVITMNRTTSLRQAGPPPGRRDRRGRRLPRDPLPALPSEPGSAAACRRSSSWSATSASPCCTCRRWSDWRSASSPRSSGWASTWCPPATSSARSRPSPLPKPKFGPNAGNPAGSMACSPADRPMPTVVAGKFEDLVAVGLEVLIAEDPSLDLVARDVPVPELEEVVDQSTRPRWCC